VELSRIEAAASDKALSAPLELLQGSRPLRALAATSDSLPFQATTLARPSHLDVTTVTAHSSGSKLSRLSLSSVRHDFVMMKNQGGQASWFAEPH
jgi:hypothetical protein